MVDASALRSRVLVVDDEKDVAKTLALLFEAEGWETQCAHTVVQAELQVAAFQPAVVICDLTMPGDDGLAFVRRLSADPLHQGTTWIAYAWRAEARIHAECLTAGFSGVLLKPGSPGELTLLLAEFER